MDTYLRSLLIIDVIFPCLHFSFDFEGQKTSNLELLSDFLSLVSGSLYAYF